MPVRDVLPLSVFEVLVGLRRCAEDVLVDAGVRLVAADLRVELLLRLADEEPVLIQEPDTDAAGVQFIDVNVPPYDPRRGFLLPPVIVDDMVSWLGLAIDPDRASMKSFPFAMGGKAFLPRTSFEVSPGKVEKLVLISYQSDRPIDPSAQLTIRSSVTDASGQFVPGGAIKLTGVERNEGRRTYILDYTPEKLQPGDYTLRIGLSEPGVGQVESYTRLKIGSND